MKHTFVSAPVSALAPVCARPLYRRQFLAGLCGVTAAALVGCGKPQDPARPASGLDPAQSYEVVARDGRGFTVGAVMSAHTVYVVFDPQCPHCAQLWQQSLALHDRVKFVWLPVAIMNARSAPQGAALLAAANPVEAMTAHEASILVGTGGMAAPDAVPADIAAGIQGNTRLLGSMGVESVPWLIAKNAQTGQVVTHNGALDTAALAKWLGID